MNLALMRLSAHVDRLERDSKLTLPNDIQLMDDGALNPAQQHFAPTTSVPQTSLPKKQAAPQKVAAKTEKVDLPILQDKLNKLDFGSVFKGTGENKTEIRKTEDVTELEKDSKSSR